MARPRRTTSDAFYDVFADMPLADQAAALKILEQVHRLAVRDAAKARKDAAPPAPALAYEDEDRDEGKTREQFQEERCPTRE